LDIGFGNGALLLTAQEYGYDVLGVDLRQQYISALSLFDIDVRCMNVLDLKDYNSFDVISLLDVLEHIAFPTPILQHINKLLKKGGFCLLSMPNMDSFIWKIRDQNNQCTYWGEIEHCHNFTRKRLYRYLEEFSLQPISYNISLRYPSCMEIIAKKIS